MNASYRFAILACLVMIGCTETENPLIEQTQQRVIRAELNDEPQSIAVAAENFSEGMQVTIAGRIFGRETSPFDEQEARFTIIELPEPGHSHEDPNDCPFCKRKRDQAALAMIQISGDDGQPIKMPANKLLNLEANQDVAVQGTCTMVGELLVLQADAIEVLDEASATELAKRFHTQPESDSDS